MLDDERGGHVEHRHDDYDRRDCDPIERRRQPARREGEQQVDDHGVEDPRGDPPGAVRGRVLGLREDGERPQGARGDQQGSEPIVAPRQRRDADGHRSRDHQSAGDGDPPAIRHWRSGEGQGHRAGAQRRRRDREDRDRGGRQAPLRSSLHPATLRPFGGCPRGCDRRGHRLAGAARPWKDRDPELTCGLRAARPARDPPAAAQHRRGARRRRPGAVPGRRPAADRVDARLRVGGGGHVRRARGQARRGAAARSRPDGRPHARPRWAGRRPLHHAGAQRSGRGPRLRGPGGGPARRGGGVWRGGRDEQAAPASRRASRHSGSAARPRRSGACTRRRRYA